MFNVTDYEAGVLDSWLPVAQVSVPRKLTQEMLDDICLWMQAFRPHSRLMLVTNEDIEEFAGLV